MVVGYIAPLPGRNTANDALHDKLDKEVDGELFAMLANQSSWGGELSQCPARGSNPIDCYSSPLRAL